MKYKLLKKFPDCNLEVGDTIDFGNSDSVEVYTGKVLYWYTLNEVKQYPEFFEEVVEKDYEILSIWNQVEGDSKSILSDSNVNTWINGSEFVRTGWVIYSIKRLSDGVVFSIGDKVEWNWLDESKFFTIKGFELGNEYYPDKIAVNLEYEDGKTTYLFQNLVTDTNMNFRHYKEPVLVSKDGVDLYEGDTCWAVYADKKQAVTDHPTSTTISKVSDQGIFYRFSTKKAAQAYIDSLQPKVLYITEDGYEVREFDKELFHWVAKEDAGKYYIATECKLVKIHLEKGYCLGEGNTRWTIFYSEEKAKEFVAKKNEEALLDSKVLSYNDVQKILDEIVYVCGSGVGFNRFFDNTALEIKLKELVRSKQ